MNDIEISNKETLTVGATWKKTIDLVPQGGTLTLTSVTDFLMARDSTTNVDSSFVTGSPSVSGSQITTGEVGTGSLLPAIYTYYLLVVTSAGTYCLFQVLEFTAMKGK